MWIRRRSRRIHRCDRPDDRCGDDGAGARNDFVSALTDDDGDDAAIDERASGAVEHAGVLGGARPERDDVVRSSRHGTPNDRSCDDHHGGRAVDRRAEPRAGAATADASGRCRPTARADRR